jgi:PKD repeat protein
MNRLNMTCVRTHVQKGQFMQITNNLFAIALRWLVGSVLVAILAACGAAAEREPVLPGPDVVIPPVTTTVANQPPVGSFTATPNGLTVTFNASASRDPDGTILGYQWNFGDGTTVLNTTSATVTHVFANSGTFMVNLIVLDSQGTVSSVVSQNITVAPIPPTNQAPIARFTAANVDTTAAVNATISTDADGTITSYAWNFGEPASSTNTATGNSATHVYASTGSFVVSLTVTDNGGLTAVSTQTVNIGSLPNVNPVPQFTFSRDALLVVFNASASTDSGGTITNYAWNFGESTSTSNTATGVTTTHAYRFAGSYTVTLVVTDNRGASVTTAQGFTVSPPAAVATGQLNDTGITASQCYQAGTATFVLCSSELAIATVGQSVTSFAPQDGMTGRDTDTNNTALDGALGFSFTKIGASGETLPASATQWSCVKDNVTGLMWERKTTDGGLYDINKTFTHLDNTNLPQFVSGAFPTLAQINAATNSIGFKNTVNADALCGATDWRLPETEELQSIADYSSALTNVLGTAWFTVSANGNSYISAAAAPALPPTDHVVFLGGTTGVQQGVTREAQSASIRLVRGAPSSPPASPRFLVFDQEVFDNKTGLTWRICAEGMTYSPTGGLCTGNPFGFSHEGALIQAAAVGQGWRLPNIKELNSIVDRNFGNGDNFPALDPAGFPGATVGLFWASTPVTEFSSFAWVVDFRQGFITATNRNAIEINTNRVRLVRNGCFNCP